MAVVEVGVVEDDGGGLAAELEADPLELLAAHRGDLAAGGGRAGEGDLVDARVGDQVLADLAAAGDDVDDARRGRRPPAGARPSGSRRAGVSGAGLTTTVQPASSAGTTFDMIVNCGTFHGGMAATTPTGSRRTSTGVPSTPVRVSSHGYSRAMPRKASICIHGAGDCARLENDVGEPISVVIRSAISASLPAYSPEKAWTTSMRSCGVIRGHGPWSKARRAAATAASMSAGVPSGTCATTCSVCGETTSIVCAGGGRGPAAVDVEGVAVEGHGGSVWVGSVRRCVARGSALDSRCGWIRGRG